MLSKTTEVIEDQNKRENIMSINVIIQSRMGSKRLPGKNILGNKK